MRGKLALLLILILALGFLAARLFPREKAEHYPDFGGGEDEKLRQWMGKKTGFPPLS